jgi:hypothetical protein
MRLVDNHPHGVKASDELAPNSSQKAKVTKKDIASSLRRLAAKIEGLR